MCYVKLKYQGYQYQRPTKRTCVVQIFFFKKKGNVQVLLTKEMLL